MPSQAETVVLIVLPAPRMDMRASSFTDRSRLQATTRNTVRHRPTGRAVACPGGQWSDRRGSPLLVSEVGARVREQVLLRVSGERAEPIPRERLNLP